jgi:hypothetical protein
VIQNEIIDEGLFEHNRANLSFLYNVVGLSGTLDQQETQCKNTTIYNEISRNLNLL